MKILCPHCEREHEWDISSVDEAFETLSQKMNEALAFNIQRSSVPGEILGCFAEDYKLNPFESLCVFLKDNSLDDIVCGNLWIDYLISMCAKFVELCGDDNKRVLQNYFELHIGEFDNVEDCFLERFLLYCREFENENIRKAYYRE